MAAPKLSRFKVESKFLKRVAHITLSRGWKDEKTVNNSEKKFTILNKYLTTLENVSKGNDSSLQRDAAEPQLTTLAAVKEGISRLLGCS